MFKWVILVLAVLAANCLRLHTEAKAYELYDQRINIRITVRLQDGNLFIDQCPGCSAPYQVDDIVGTFKVGESTCSQGNECQDEDGNKSFDLLHKAVDYYKNENGIIYFYDVATGRSGILAPLRYE